jgi:hypothetical protein
MSYNAIVDLFTALARAGNVFTSASGVIGQSWHSSSLSMPYHISSFKIIYLSQYGCRLGM